MEYNLVTILKISEIFEIIKKKKLMKLLITGACGHIGSYLVENIHKIKKIKGMFY